MLSTRLDYRLDGRKGSFFWGKGLCKGHEKRCKGHVQGPQIWQIELGARATWICARATRRGARASDVCKGHTNDTQYNLVQGPQLVVQGALKFWKILRPLHLFSWPLHMVLAPLLVALAQALAPEK